MEDARIATAAPLKPSLGTTQPRRGRKQGKARRDELRAVALASVERLLRTGTAFADLNVALLAQESGISRSTFYAYFVDIPTLLRSWYEEFHHRILGSAREWWALDGSATRDDLRAALKHIIVAHLQRPELLKATHEAVGQNSEVLNAVQAAMQAYITGLDEHIQAGQRAGYVDPSLPPAETAYWLQWMVERGLHMMGSQPDGAEQGMLDAYTAIVWNTLYLPVRGG